ncbi:MAG TPA: hypothetical protein VH254_01390 [Candidatus Udaeobacter sp.]|jgi:hypothetical protein|nr:hypothetical protein [Candidatus Udaeobacter sp.]
MKLSVEAKVAAAVAVAFVALTVGAIAQGNGAGQIGSPDGYPRVNTQTEQEGYNTSLTGRMNPQENSHKSKSTQRHTHHTQR